MFHQTQTWAVFAIDHQKLFCDPDFTTPPGSLIRPNGTENTNLTCIHNDKIIKTLRGLGCKIFQIYQTGWLGGKDYFTAFGGPHIVCKQENDVLVPKFEESVFYGSAIQTEFQNNFYTGIIFLGFNASSCVLQSVVDARKTKYDRIVFEDCIADGKSFDLNEKGKSIEIMRRTGAKIMKAQDFLKNIRILSANPNSNITTLDNN